MTMLVNECGFRFPAFEIDDNLFERLTDVCGQHLGARPSNGR